MTEDPFYHQLFLAILSGVVARHPNDSHVYLHTVNLTNKVYADHLEHRTHPTGPTARTSNYPEWIK